MGSRSSGRFKQIARFNAIRALPVPQKTHDLKGLDQILTEHQLDSSHTLQQIWLEVLEPPSDGPTHLADSDSLIRFLPNEESEHLENGGWHDRPHVCPGPS